MAADDLTARATALVLSPVGCACFNVRRASRAISQLYDEALSEVGLRSNQYSLLIGIEVGGHLGIGAIAERLVTDRTTLTRTVATLVEMGLVEESRGNDKRNRLLQLTRQGRRTLKSAMPLWEGVQARVRDEIGESGMQALRSLSDQVVQLAHPEFEIGIPILEGRTQQ